MSVKSRVLQESLVIILVSDNVFHPLFSISLYMMGALSSRVVSKGLSVDRTGRMLGPVSGDTVSQFWCSVIIRVSFIHSSKSCGNGRLPLPLKTSACTSHVMHQQNSFSTKCIALLH